MVLALICWIIPAPTTASEEALPLLILEIYEPAVIDLTKGGDETLLDEWTKTQEELKKPALKPKSKATAKVPRVTRFAPGHCTDYVARKKSIPWGGNANRWIAHSQKFGAIVNKVPAVGAILVTNESGYGHVTYIEAVNGTTVEISEWNYAGLYKLTYRTLDITDRRITGIIHYE